MANLKTNVPIDRNLLINIIQSNYPSYSITQHESWFSVNTGFKSQFAYSGIVNIDFKNPKNIRIGLEPRQPFATLIWFFPPLIAGFLHLIDLNSRPIVIEFKNLLERELNNVNESDLQSPSVVVNEQIQIPDHCPHCKNPNTKKLHLCEWCGSQIC
jgi:hypothetical protein